VTVEILNEVTEVPSFGQLCVLLDQRALILQEDRIVFEGKPNVRLSPFPQQIRPVREPH